MWWTTHRVVSRLGRLESALFHPIIRRFLGDLHVVDVAFTGTRRRDAKQLRLPLQLGNRCTSAVAHSRTEPADELVNHRRHASFVRDATFDPFRHQLVRRAAALEIELVLKIPVAAATAPVSYTHLRAHE